MPFRKISTKDLLKLNSGGVPDTVERRVLSENLIERKCNICGIERWFQDKVPIRLDYIILMAIKKIIVLKI